MAKKTGKKDFNHSPFKKLKGLSVPNQEQKQAAPVPGSAPPAARDEDFTSAMASLGVSRLPVDESEPSELPDQGEVSPVTAEALPTPDSEQDEFLAALGGIDVRFEDELPEEEPQAPLRRMKLLQRGKLHLDRDLDLHGLTRTEAEEKFRFFLQDAAYQGWAAVRVITGRGLHSSETPVLRDAIEQLLNRGAFPAVVEWGRAPRRLGGSGALILFLRK